MQSEESSPFRLDQWRQHAREWRSKAIRSTGAHLSASARAGAAAVRRARRRGQQGLFTVLKRFVNRVETESDRIGKGRLQDLMSDEETLDPPSSLYASEDEGDAERGQRAAEVEEARAGCGRIKARDHREVKEQEFGHRGP